MIKLFLHCGYHKTGSSFLQVMFAQNRHYLSENGFYFPSSKEDKNMLKGKISPGNGMDLVKAIGEASEEQIIDLLKKWIDKAIVNKYDSILISSEGLFHVLAKRKLMKVFMNACNKTGVIEVNGLLFFRNPISHAFSVYKHRAKGGKISNFQDWLKNDYETLDLTESFLNTFKEFNIEWLFQKYASDSKHMAKIAFEDFLGLKTPDLPKNERVNISLTLSEIIMIREIKDLIPREYITKIHAELSDLPMSKKANDLNLKVFYEKVGYDTLGTYKKVIEGVNELLPSNEILEFNRFELKNITMEEAISLSRHQLKIFFSAVHDSNHLQNRFTFLIKHFWARIKQKLT